MKLNFRILLFQFTWIQDMIDISGLIISKESRGRVSHEASISIGPTIRIGMTSCHIVIASIQAIEAPILSNSFYALSKCINSCTVITIRQFCLWGCKKPMGFGCCCFQMLQYLLHQWGKCSSGCGISNTLITTRYGIEVLRCLLKEITGLVPQYTKYNISIFQFHKVFLCFRKHKTFC